MDISVNIWAVVLAAVSSFLLGGLWYSPILFGRVWNRENGGEPQHGHPAKVFGVSFLFSLIAATCFAYWLGPAPALDAAVCKGALAGEAQAGGQGDLEQGAGVELHGFAVSVGGSKNKWAAADAELCQQPNAAAKRQRH